MNQYLMFCTPVMDRTLLMFVNKYAPRHCMHASYLGSNEAASGSSSSATASPQEFLSPQHIAIMSSPSFSGKGVCMIGEGQQERLEHQEEEEEEEAALLLHQAYNGGMEKVVTTTKKRRGRKRKNPQQPSQLPLKKRNAWCFPIITSEVCCAAVQIGLDTFCCLRTHFMSSRDACPV